MHNKLALLHTLTLLILLGIATVALFRVSSFSKIFVLLGLYASALLLSYSSGASLAGLGLEVSGLAKGLRLALPFIAVITIAGVLLLFIQPTLFQDARYQQSLGGLLLTTLVIIPLGTVIIEELFFRGLLLDILVRTTSVPAALALSSVAFGIWHVFSAQKLSISVLHLPQPVLILGVIIVTSFAGLFFSWLRLTSGSLLAPILVHWAINASGAVLAYSAWQQQ